MFEVNGYWLLSILGQRVIGDRSAFDSISLWHETVISGKDRIEIVKSFRLQISRQQILQVSVYDTKLQLLGRKWSLV